MNTEKKSQNLIDGLQAEMNRVRGIIEVYKQYPGGEITSWLMQQDIDSAEKSISDGDIVNMVIYCKKLQEWEL